MRDQFNKRVQLVDHDESDDDDENYIVLNVEGEDENSKPFYMKSFINGNRFRAVIDSGSSVFSFALDEQNSIMKGDMFCVREMIKGENYVDFNEKNI